MTVVTFSMCTKLILIWINHCQLILKGSGTYWKPLINSMAFTPFLQKLCDP
jgi:hypothetical protein